MEMELKEGMAMIGNREVPVLDRAELRREMGAAMIPCALLNPDTSKTHFVNANSCMHESPSMWTTKCGWAWIRSGSNARPIFEHDEVEAFVAARCSKCLRNKL